MLVKYEPYQAKNILHKVDHAQQRGYHEKSGYSINPYMGCAVGCRYCFVQEKKYSDSSGLEDEKDKVVQVKINAPYLLKKKLLSGIEKGIITIGESCEPFAPIEDEFFITQRLLEVLKDYDYPLHIITRFPRLLRDIDLIKQINSRTRVIITLSLPVISRDIMLKLEGDTPSIKERLRTLKVLRKNGIEAGVAVAPVMPHISDGDELTNILKKVSDSGAAYVVFSPLIIKEYQKDMFLEWLSEKYKGLVDAYKRLYEEREDPGEDYWIEFMEKARKKAAQFDLNIGIPYFDTEYEQRKLFSGNKVYG